MKKIDIILALITGEGVAWLFVWLIKKSAPHQISGGGEFGFLTWLLPVFLPILALTCLWFAYLIGKRFIFVFQLAKFLLIVALFALIDLTVLNFLMIYFGITAGMSYLVFVTVSFIVATCLKYVADKYWAFEKFERTQLSLEFGKFFIITIISAGIQIGIADLVVNKIGVQFGIDPLIWGNIGKLAGITIASAWNFLGYKFIVFKK